MTRNIQKLKETMPTVVKGSLAHKISQERLLYLLIQEQEKIAKSLIREAKKGNVIAIREVFDRLYGKPKETIDFGGEVKFSLKSLAHEREKLRESIAQDVINDDDVIDVQVQDMSDT